MNIDFNVFPTENHFLISIVERNQNAENTTLIFSESEQYQQRCEKHWFLQRRDQDWNKEYVSYKNLKKASLTQKLFLRSNLRGLKIKKSSPCLYITKNWPPLPMSLQHQLILWVSLLVISLLQSLFAFIKLLESVYSQ